MPDSSPPQNLKTAPQYNSDDKNSTTSLQISSEVNVALSFSFAARLGQYLQSKTQSLLKRIFKRETHRPSEENVWQIPADTVFPRCSFFPLRLDPLEVHATSYFAASAKIFNFLSKGISLSVIVSPLHKHMFRKFVCVHSNTPLLQNQELLICRRQEDAPWK